MPITVDDIREQIKRIDINEATQKNDIPKKLAKRLGNLIVDYPQENFNSCLKKGSFPNDFKKAVVHSTHKNDNKTEKSNYRPISISPNLSKIHDFYLTKCILIVRDIAPHTACWLWLKKLRKLKTTTKYVLRSLLISQKHLIVFCMIFLLQVTCLWLWF